MHLLNNFLRKHDRTKQVISVIDFKITQNVCVATLFLSYYLRSLAKECI